MRIIKADKIFDGEQFIPFNAVVVQNNCIKDIIFVDERTSDKSANIETLNGILVPGFINVHCHLELSYLHHQFSAKCGMVGFLNQMFEKRNLFDKKQIFDAAKNWDKRMYENGIVAVGDIVNTDYIIELKKESKIKYINFIEIFGLNKNQAGKIFEDSMRLLQKHICLVGRSYTVPHSPYSLSDTLWEYFLDFLNQTSNQCTSVHFLESIDEKNLIENLPSRMRSYFTNNLKFSDEDINHLSKNFYTYLIKILDLSKKIILVHNTYLDEKYLNIFSNYKEKIFFCLCPNANMFIECRLPDLNLLSNFTKNICIGTDSLASNYNLSIIDEMNVLLNNFDMSIEEVLKMGTSNGARALNIDHSYGFIKKGYKIPLNLIQIEKGNIKHIQILE